MFAHLMSRLAAAAASLTLAAGTVVVGATLTAAPAAAAPTACAVGSGTYTNFGTPSGPRKLKIVVPAGATPNTPMIVSMHGATGSAESQETTSGFTTIGQRDNAIVVYPQSVGTIPNTVWDITPGSKDIQFVAQATQFMHAYGCSNPTKTYLNGFSMGAMMTSRLICERGNLYAGAAMVGGIIDPEPGCVVDKNKPIVAVHGKADTAVFYNGGEAESVVSVTGVGTLSPVDRAAITGHWASQAKNCGATRLETGAYVNTVDFSCRYSTTQILVHSGAHVWNPPTGSPVYNTSEYIWATMRPTPACTVGNYSTNQTSTERALAQSLADRAAADAAFKVWLGRIVTVQMTCNPDLAAQVSAAVQQEVTANPTGWTATRLREALSQP